MTAPLLNCEEYVEMQVGSLSPPALQMITEQCGVSLMRGSELPEIPV
jgi:hypothetical protein